MLTRVQTVALSGLAGQLVQVETDLANGFPSFAIVGLPDVSIQEAKERIRAAIKNSDLEFPGTRHLTINLAPADVAKEGSAYDLPMAVGILLGQLGLEFDHKSSLFLGELALDGSLRRVPGVLPAAIFAREHNLETIYIPLPNAAEAALVPGLKIIPLKNLKELIAHLRQEKLIEPYAVGERKNSEARVEVGLDMSEIKGQEFVKRALEIAASGGHNILMFGPPGSGKTLLAKTFSTILPSMSEAECLEVTKIYSVANLLTPDNPMIMARPFRSPHHTASGISLVGGGRFPRPGEISLAHRGVLFLDELPEFPRSVLENLRQPLEDGEITVARAQGTLVFPARFILLASQNPCPCGYSSDPDRSCTCSPMQIIKYQKKISGPLLDRIDLHIEVPRVPFSKLSAVPLGETSLTIRKRVELARKIQLQRFQKTESGEKHNKIFCNAEMGNSDIQKFCKLNQTALEILRQAVEKLKLSARSYHRILKISRTIADLGNAQEIAAEHVAEALQYRTKVE